MKIYAASPCETVLYAAEELKKYLEMMDPTVCAEIVPGEGTDGILLSVGLYEGIDPMVDDVIDAEVNSLSGFITGSNGRSVLMGVYNYLKSAGCLWVRPGKKGEFIPKKEMAAHTFSMHKKADCPFRGECIEGAVSLEHVLDTIEWLPKINMNLFMMEQIVPYNYIGRWYTHMFSQHKQDEGVSYEDVEKMIPVMEMAIKKCGLQLHALGHGYQFERYGISDRGNNAEYIITDEAREAMALLNGKRGLNGQSPFHTQICMSNEKVMKGQVEFLVEYLEKKPYIDFLHVWLADGANNHCECEECRKHTPSDFYAILLNMLDEALTARGIDTKIVFIMYTDTKWAPEQVKLNQTDRFILTTAVGERDRTVPYNPERYPIPLKPYKRNDNHLDATFPINLSYLDGWTENGFTGRKFLFEYYLYYYHYMDPGYMYVSREMYADTQTISSTGFDGVMQDRTQRSSFPTALPMAIQGEGLFDSSLTYEAYTEKFFAASFGADGKEAFDYLNGVSEIFMPRLLRRKDYLFPSEDELNQQNLPKETAERLSAIYDHLEKYKEVIARNQNKGDICRDESWKILSLHTEYCRLLADMFITLTTEGQEAAQRSYEKLWYWLSATEDDLNLYLDMFLCARRMGIVVKYPHERMRV